MKRTKYIAAALALAATLPAVPAHAAGAPRTFVSAAGSDTNNCANVATPCRHFQTAVTATAPGGEVVALDPANYGSMTINHQITINGHGWAYVAPQNGGNAIIITAGSTDNVTIHGVVLDGIGATGGTNGILFNSGASLTLENSTIQNMTNDGLAFESTATTQQTLAVSSSYINNNGGYGIYIATGSSGAIRAAIDRIGLYGNANDGLLVFSTPGVTGAPIVAVTDSIAANNGGCGFCVTANSAAPVSNLSLTHVLSEGNATGVAASALNSTIWLAQSTLTGNAQGFNIVGGNIFSYGDNYFAANGSSSGSLSVFSKQ